MTRMVKVSDKDETMMEIIGTIRKLLQGIDCTRRIELDDKIRSRWERVMGFRINIVVHPYHNKENVSGYYAEISAQGAEVAHFCIDYNTKNVIFPSKNIIHYAPCFGLNHKVLASLIDLAFESPQNARTALRTEHFDDLLAC